MADRKTTGVKVGWARSLSNHELNIGHFRRGLVTLAPNLTPLTIPRSITDE